LQRDRQAGSRELEITDLANLGNVHQLAGRLEKALEYLSQALDLAETLDLPLAKVHTLFARGLAWERGGHFEAAEYDYRAAVVVVEEIRGRLMEEFQRIDFLADRLAPYRRLVLLLSHHLARPGQALDYVERARSRTFLDLLEPSNLQVSPLAGAGEPLSFQELIRLLI
jgi:tetratricopeptide (TPR) repeat protein